MDYAGYYFNGYHNFNTYESSSFERRRDIFRDKITKVYSIKPVTFIGSLFHDLRSCSTGMMIILRGGTIEQLTFVLSEVRAALAVTNPGCGLRQPHTEQL